MHIVSAFSTMIRSCVATLAVMIGVLSLPGSTAHATTLASDDFNYTGTLVNKSGGVGFGSAWTAVASYADPILTTGSMSYSSGGISLVTSGNKLQPAAQSRATRNFSSALSAANQTMWVSFRINQTDTGTLPAHHAGFALYSGVNGTGSSIFMGKGWNATNWGIDLAGVVAQKSGAVTTADRNAFLVYKLVFTTSQVTVSMWVNPAFSEGSLGTAHATLTGSWSSTIASMFISAGNTAANYQFDEFRLGTVFTDVTPTTLIASDDFNYTGNLVAKNGGTGFGSNAWAAFSGYADPALATGSMAYTNGSNSLQTSGNKLQPAAQSRATRNFSSALSAANQTMWVSFRINQTDTGTLPAHHAGFALYSGVNGTGSSIFMGKGWNATNWGIDLAGVVAQKSGAVTTADRNAFLVYKLVFTTTQVTVSMWVNPAFSEGSLGTAHATLTGSWSSTIASMFISAGNTAANYQFDEFRMGTSFDAVTPRTTSTGQPDIVIYGGNTATGDLHGAWAKVSDGTAGGGNCLNNATGGFQSTPLASPADYVDIRFNAPANVPYRLWMRMKAAGNSSGNDSVFVQFDRTINSSGSQVNRNGTTSAWTVTLEEGTSRGVSGWGWASNSYGWGMIGDAIIFDASGQQVLRIQRREQGSSIDQIVLSPLVNTYFCKAPGALKNDATILPQSTIGTVPPAATDLRVLCWNNHKGKSTAEGAVGNIERTASFIVRSGATLVGLNEVKGSLGHPASLETFLEAKTGKAWNRYYVDADSGTGNMILSQHTLSNTTYQTLAPGTRNVVKAQLTVNGTTFNFLCTHLDAWDQSARVTAANSIVSMMSGLSSSGPCVLVGDMNATPGTTEINALMTPCDESWKQAVAAGTATAYPDNPVSNTTKTHHNHIDFIFITRNQTLVTTLSGDIPDLRDPFTYNTDPNGPRNSIGDLLAIGIFTGDATYGTNVLNTHDDKGIRPSDHNQVRAVLKVGP